MGRFYCQTPQEDAQSPLKTDDFAFPCKCVKARLDTDDSDSVLDAVLNLHNLCQRDLYVDYVNHLIYKKKMVENSLFTSDILYGSFHRLLLFLVTPPSQDCWSHQFAVALANADILPAHSRVVQFLLPFLSPLVEDIIFLKCSAVGCRRRCPESDIWVAKQTVRRVLGPFKKWPTQWPLCVWNRRRHWFKALEWKICLP